MLATLAGLLAQRTHRPRDDASAAYRSTSRTHVGLVRSINEDRVLDRPDAGLWAVIDGMGGHAAGDIAADTALRALSELADRGCPTIEEVAATLRETNRCLYEAGQVDGRIRGATAVVLILTGYSYAICWVGDCRAYCQRDTVLEQLTRDHSIVQELIRAGQLTTEQAKRHPRANVVTRALGAAETLAIEILKGTFREGDLVLLCSDGLARGLTELPSMSVRQHRLASIADALVGAAIESDGGDNVSVVLVSLEAAG